MELHVGFDDELMCRYHRRGASPLFTIYWTHGQEAYPEEGWVDFGSVVLGWWLVAAKSLLSGSGQESLLFMDGPYELSVRPVGNLFHISMTGRSEAWKVDQTSFIHELLSAASQATTRLHELGIPDSEGLQIGIRELKAVFSEQEARTPRAAKQYAHR